MKSRKNLRTARALVALLATLPLALAPAAATPRAATAIAADFAVTADSAAFVAANAGTNADMQEVDIITTISNDGSFTILVKLLGDAGLTTTLRGPGPFTVFAPTDEAFRKLPAAIFEALSRDRSRLRSVLLYHVIAGRLMAADALKLAGTTRKTVEGREASMAASGTVPMINNARVTKADIVAKNGVIHGIDAVMMPSDK